MLNTVRIVPERWVAQGAAVAWVAFATESGSLQDGDYTVTSADGEFEMTCFA